MKPQFTTFTDFKKNLQVQNSMEIHPAGAKMFHGDKQADRQTDMTKLMVAFCDFENMLKDGFQHSTGDSEHRNH